MQLGGADQWGNIVTGCELIRKLNGEKVFAATTPLLIKTDGGKFGKTEKGNIWLNPKKTSPYTFYQFWLNTSDEDAKKYIRIFTTLSKKEIQELEIKHDIAPHERALQKTLAKDITSRIHSENDTKTAIAASTLLFGKSTYEDIVNLDEKTLLDVFKDVPLHEVKKNKLEKAIHAIDFLSSPTTNIFDSKSEARRMLKSNAISINKRNINEEKHIDKKDLIRNKFIIVQKGKKNYHLIKVI